MTIPEENKRLEDMQLAMAELLGWTKLKRNKRGILMGIAPHANGYQGSRPSCAGEWPWTKSHWEYLLASMPGDMAMLFNGYLSRVPGLDYAWRATAEQLTIAYLQMKGQYPI
jgi:hypothetical protein